MNVFTYGTLMFPEVWRVVVGRMFATTDGTAPGYAIYRVRDGVFPGIIVASNSIVRGVVYLDVDDESVARLDRFEDDFYDRKAIEVHCNDGRRLTPDAYVVPEKNRHILTDEIWDRDTFVATGGLDQFIARFAGFRRVATGE